MWRGGARKGRIGDATKGKSGGFRYVYLYLEKAETIYLFILYAKNERADLSGEERKVLAAIVKEYKDLYGEKDDK